MTRGTVRGTLAAAAASALLVGVAAGPAAADWDTSLGGLWYVSETGVDQAHQTTTGEGVTIALLDGPVNVDVPTLAGADIRTQPDYVCPDLGVTYPGTSTDEVAEHGTSMAEILVGNGAEIDGFPGPRGVAPDATILSYVVVVPEGIGSGPTTTCPELVGESILAAVDAGADIISMSIGTTLGNAEIEAIATALRAGVVLVNAVPNTPPADGVLSGLTAANGLVTVEAHDIDSQLMEDPVSSPLLTVVSPGVEIVRTGWENGAWNAQWLTSGTSEATAFTSGALALAAAAHPDATGNQLIQSLIRTTGGTVHDPARDDTTGYGLISVPALVATDPTTFEDVNPLLRDDPDARPSLAEIDGTASAPTTDTGQTGDADDSDDSSFSAPLWIGAAGLLVLVVIVAIIATRRRGRSGPPGPPNPTGPGQQPYPPGQQQYPPGQQYPQQGQQQYPPGQQQYPQTPPRQTPPPTQHGGT